MSFVCPLETNSEIPDKDGFFWDTDIPDACMSCLQHAEQAPLTYKQEAVNSRATAAETIRFDADQFSERYRKLGLKIISDEGDRQAQIHGFVPTDDEAGHKPIECVTTFGFVCLREQ